MTVNWNRHFNCISQILIFFRTQDNEDLLMFKPRLQPMFMPTLIQMRAIDCERHYNYMTGIWDIIDEIYWCIEDNTNVQLGELATVKEQLHTLFDKTCR